MGLRAIIRKNNLEKQTIVSIYPKAEMGLRVFSRFTAREKYVSGFNLPEGRDGFKS